MESLIELLGVPFGIPAWTVVAVLALIVLRPPITRAIDRMSSLEIRGFKAAFGRRPTCRGGVRRGARSLESESSST